MFWKNHPIYLANSTEGHYSHKSRTRSTGSSSSEEDESKFDPNVPDDERFFVHSEMDTTETNVQRNNMMDIFRRESSLTNETSNTRSETRVEPIRSSTPEKDTSPRVLAFTEQDQETNGEMNGDFDDDDDDELSLQDNFSFLIAKGMLKPSTS